MTKFSNIKIGNRVWSIQYKWGVVTSYYANLINSIDVLFDNGIRKTYTIEGKRKKEDAVPELFWNEFYIPTDEEDKKPFDLVEFLKDNFDRKFFIKGDKNYQIVYSHFYNEFYFNYSDEYENIPVVFIKSKNCNNSIKSLVDKLNENKVTKEQLIEAYKELKWI